MLTATVKYDVLHKALSALLKLSDRVTMAIDIDGIRARGYDDASVSEVDVFIGKGAFLEYAADFCHVYVDVDELLMALERIGRTDAPLHMGIDDARAVIRGPSGEEEAPVRQISPDYPSQPDYDASASFNREWLANAINSLPGDVVRLSIERDMGLRATSVDLDGNLTVSYRLGAIRATE
jgi:hypothetical protein